MFLDDQLLQIGRNAKTDSEKDIFEAINTMWQACMINLNKNINDKSTNDKVLAQFKRVNNTWKLVADKLEKEGVVFIKRDGFEIILKGMDVYKSIVKAMGI